MPSQIRAVDTCTSGAWANPNNAFTENDLCTSTSTSGAQNFYVNYVLRFTIPSGAIINGIEVKTIRGGDVDDYYTIELRDKNAVFRLKNGTPYQATCANGVAQTLGSPTDLWGGVWDAEHFNSAQMTIILTFVKSGKANPFYVDYIEITVYYTEVGERTVIVTNEDVKPQNGYVGDPITYTATVKDSVGQPLPASFIADLLMNSTILLDDQPFNSYVYDEVTGLLTLQFNVPDLTPNGKTVSLKWNEQTI